MNKVATKVSLVWNVERSDVLGPRQRDRVRAALAGRITAAGDLRVSSDRYRSQMRNREDAKEKLARLLAEALKVQRPRTATKPSKAATERRLKAKKHRSEIKKRRRLPPVD